MEPGVKLPIFSSHALVPLLKNSMALFSVRRTTHLFFTMTLCLPILAWADVDVGGITVPEQVVVQGQRLVLNGAGVRSVFIFDIYVAALFLPEHTSNAKEITDAMRPAEIRLYFLRGGAGQGLLARGWTSGFEHNQSPAAMARLKVRLAQFNALFSDVNKGDAFVFDFLTEHSTYIRINGTRRSIIPGADFQRALLSVWLGAHPADRALKKALLGRQRAG